MALLVSIHHTSPSSSLLLIIPECSCARILKAVILDCLLDCDISSHLNPGLLNTELESTCSAFWKTLLDRRGLSTHDSDWNDDILPLRDCRYSGNTADAIAGSDVIDGNEVIEWSDVIACEECWLTSSREMFGNEVVNQGSRGRAGEVMGRGVASLDSEGMVSDVRDSGSRLMSVFSWRRHLARRFWNHTWELGKMQRR